MWQLPALTLREGKHLQPSGNTLRILTENHCQHLKAILAWPKCMYFYKKKSSYNGIITVCTFRMWKCFWLLQGFRNIISECSFCIISIFIISLYRLYGEKTQEYETFFGSACFFSSKMQFYSQAFITLLEFPFLWE